MSWLKRTLKKVTNTVKDVGRTAVNVSPIGMVYGAVANKPIVGGHRYENKKFGNTVNKVMPTLGKVGLVAAGGTAAVVGAGGTAAIGSTIKRALAKKSAGTTTKKLIAPAKIGSPGFAATKPAGSSLSNALTGVRDGSGLLSSFIPKDSKVGKLLSGLPRLGDIINGAGNGAVKGAEEVIEGSQTAEEVKKQQITEYLKENAPKAIIAFLGVLVAVLAYMNFSKNSTKKGRRK